MVFPFPRKHRLLLATSLQCHRAAELRRQPDRSRAVRRPTWPGKGWRVRTRIESVVCRISYCSRACWPPGRQGALSRTMATPYKRSRQESSMEACATRLPNTPRRRGQRTGSPWPTRISTSLVSSTPNPQVSIPQESRLLHENFLSHLIPPARFRFAVVSPCCGRCVSVVSTPGNTTQRHELPLYNSHTLAMIPEHWLSNLEPRTSLTPPGACTTGVDSLPNGAMIGLASTRAATLLTPKVRPPGRSALCTTVAHPRSAEYMPAPKKQIPIRCQHRNCMELKNTEKARLP